MYTTSGDLNFGVVLEFLDLCIILEKAQGQEISECDVSGGITLKLIKTLPKNAGFTIFADNYFTSIPLVEKLQKDGFFYVGRIRVPHRRGWEREDEKNNEEKNNEEKTMGIN